MQLRIATAHPKSADRTDQGTHVNRSTRTPRPNDDPLPGDVHSHRPSERHPSESPDCLAIASQRIAKLCTTSDNHSSRANTRFTERHYLATRAWGLCPAEQRAATAPMIQTSLTLPAVWIQSSSFVSGNMENKKNEQRRIWHVRDSKLQINMHCGTQGGLCPPAPMTISTSKCRHENRHADVDRN